MSATLPKPTRIRAADLVGAKASRLDGLDVGTELARRWKTGTQNFVIELDGLADGTISSAFVNAILSTLRSATGHAQGAFEAVEWTSSEAEGLDARNARRCAEKWLRGVLRDGAPVPYQPVRRCARAKRVVGRGARTLRRTGRQSRSV